MYPIHSNHIMFRRLGVTFLLIAILCTSFFLTASADSATNDATLATVSFVDGDLELGGQVGGSGLHLFFGQHTIPVEEVSYPAENTKAGLPVDHILQVEDARVASGDWHVTVSLTSFIDVSENPAPNFDAVISMQSPVVANSNTSAGTTGLWVQEDLSIASGAQPELVMLAGKDLPRGIFTATWENANTTLNISDSEVVNLGLADYSATLNWSLNLGPM